jgi:hypothetical protein
MLLVSPGSSAAAIDKVAMLEPTADRAKPIKLQLVVPVTAFRRPFDALGKHRFERNAYQPAC